MRLTLTVYQIVNLNVALPSSPVDATATLSYWDSRGLATWIYSVLPSPATNYDYLRQDAIRYKFRLKPRKFTAAFWRSGLANKPNHKKGWDSSWLGQLLCRLSNGRPTKTWIMTKQHPNRNIQHSPDIKYTGQRSQIVRETDQALSER